MRLSSSGSPLLTGAHSSYGDIEETMETLFNKKLCSLIQAFLLTVG